MKEPEPEDVPSLWRVISGRIKIGGARVHGGAALLLVVVAASLAGYVLRSSTPKTAEDHTRSDGSPPPVVASANATASEAASAAPIPSVSSSRPGIDPGSTDSLVRLKTLELKPAKERSIDENLELARGHQQLAAAEIGSLETELEAKKLDPRTLARLRDLARDDSIAVDVLAALARHPTPATVDALYDVATDSESSQTVRYLADDLLAGPKLRAVASKELTSALDLKNAKSCEAALAAITRAKSSGDDRGLPLLRAFEKEKGCGKEGKEDCYSCLRGSSLLFEAHDALAGRLFVAPWKLGAP